MCDDATVAAEPGTDGRDAAVENTAEDEAVEDSEDKEDVE